MSLRAPEGSTGRQRKQKKEGEIGGRGREGEGGRGGETTKIRTGADVQANVVGPADGADRSADVSITLKGKKST